MEPHWYSVDPQQRSYYNFGVSLVSTSSANVQGPPVQAVSGDRRLSTNPKKYIYSLRIINPKRRSLFEVQKFTSENKYQFLGELRSYIKGEFRLNVPESDSFALGYYQKGRGNSKIYLVNGNDMDTMYSQYAEALEIPLRCDGRSGELDNSDTEPAKKRPKQDKQ